MVIIPGVIKSKDTVVCFRFVLQRSVTRAEPRACIRIKPKGLQHCNTKSIKTNTSRVVFKCTDRGHSDEPACIAQHEQRSLPSVRFVIFLKPVVHARQQFYWHGCRLKGKSSLHINIYNYCAIFQDKSWVYLNVFCLHVGLPALHAICEAQWDLALASSLPKVSDAAVL